MLTTSPTNELTGGSRFRRPCWPRLLAGALVAVWLAWLPRGGRAQQPASPGPEWVLKWAEEFDAPGDSSVLQGRWLFAYPWGRNLLGNPETQYYDGKRVEIDSAGHLLFTARRLRQPKLYRGRPLQYKSGMLFRQGTTGPEAPALGYGLYEIRCRQPHDPDSFPAFWLFQTPDEVDIFEANWGGISNNIILSPHSYWRPSWQRVQACQCAYGVSASEPGLDEGWHTYGLAWLPGELVFYFDGVPIRRDDRLLPLGLPMPTVVNLAVLNWAAMMRDTLAVDYVRYYEPRQPLTAAALNRAAFLQQPYPLVQEAYPAQTFGQRSRQRWLCRADSLGHLALELADNYNPLCGGYNELPRQPAPAPWCPPWLLNARTELELRAEPALDYRLVNQLGQDVASGTIPAGAAWRVRWPGVPAGLYRLELQHGAARLQQQVRILEPL